MRLFSKLALLLAVTSTYVVASEIAVLRNGFSIPHERRDEMGATTRLYLADGNGYVDVPSVEIEHYEKDLTPPPALPPVPAAIPAATSSQPLHINPVDAAVAASSSETRIDPDLINSVIRAESNFNPRARSPKGAQGLMQLMPQTASQLGVTNAFDPKANVNGGTRYLKQLLEQYNFDLHKALAAYNAGPQRVSQYKGVPPYRETRAYITRIILDFNRRKLAERKAMAGAAKTTASKKAETSTDPKPDAALKANRALGSGEQASR